MYFKYKIMGEDAMLHKEKNAGKRAADNSSLSKKIISKMAVITAGIFLLTILMSAFLAARSLIQVNREKLAAAAYENAFLVANDIENAYGKVVGFAGSLRNISALNPKEQRSAIDTALVGMLESGGGYPTAFAYFEQNAIAMPTEIRTASIREISRTNPWYIRMRIRPDMYLKSMKTRLTIIRKNIMA